MLGPVRYETHVESGGSKFKTVRHSNKMNGGLFALKRDTPHVLRTFKWPGSSESSHLFLVDCSATHEVAAVDGEDAVRSGEAEVAAAESVLARKRGAVAGKTAGRKTRGKDSDPGGFSGKGQTTEMRTRYQRAWIFLAFLFVLLLVSWLGFTSSSFFPAKWGQPRREPTLFSSLAKVFTFFFSFSSLLSFFSFLAA